VASSESPKEKIVVFYHGKCADGSGAAWAFNEKYKDDDSVSVKYVALRPGERIMEDTIFDNIAPGIKAVFVDISPTIAILDKMMAPSSAEGAEENQAVVGEILLIDHHASNKADLQNHESPEIEGFTAPKITKIFDLNESGATLAWKTLHTGKDVPEILKTIKKMEPEFRRPSEPGDDLVFLAAYIDANVSHVPGALENNFEFFSNFDSIDHEDKVMAGGAIFVAQLKDQEKVEDKVVYAYLKIGPDVPPDWYPIVNHDITIGTGRTMEEKLEKLAREKSPGGVVFAWFENGEGAIEMSIRTIPELQNHGIDAGKIAEYLRDTIGVTGGGHKSASGTQFEDMDQFNANVSRMSWKQRREFSYTREKNGRPYQLPTFDDTTGHVSSLAQRSAAASRREPGGKT